MCVIDDFKPWTGQHAWLVGKPENGDSCEISRHGGAEIGEGNVGYMRQRYGGGTSVAEHGNGTVGVFADHAVVVALSLITKLQKPLVDISGNLGVLIYYKAMTVGFMLLPVRVVQALTAFNFVPCDEPRIAAAKQFRSILGIPFNLAHEITADDGEAQKLGSVSGSFKGAAAGGGIDFTDPFVRNAACSCLSMQMSQLGQTVQLIIWMSVTYKYDSHSEYLLIASVVIRSSLL